MAHSKQYTAEQVEAIIKEQIVQEFMYDRSEVALENDYPLIEQGLIDSVGIFQLITLLEEQFEFTMQPDEVIMENFESVNAINSFVMAKV